ncbi:MULTISPECIES: aspartate kinase [Shewanella]|uniref:Aspartokinase n=1 Tax=Shewanella sedimentimangrovi TaxID=2814293 RepID=A0ABX7QXI0_9GAMM|nr:MULTISPECIES: aspartate kinase [Shewanella]QSX36227.1 aspartate kinase [Shewanella sedimentimangrovi]QSX39835.1 aspartate kinase [Shewanella cyperi]
MNKLYVKKFGGTSVGSLERIEAVADAIAKAHFNGEQQVLVLSAMAGETNRLFALAAEVDPKAHPRELDMLVSTGEQVSIALMTMALSKRGVKARSLCGGQVKILTNSQFGRAAIDKVETEYLKALLDSGVLPVVAGFQGVDPQGDITTLGRGGSDTTAVAIAAALKADECQIFTDVCGVYTTDPNLEPSAQKLDEISFEAMYEMAKLGAKVLHPDSVACAERYRVPLRVLSSFEHGSGTLIRFDGTDMAEAGIVGIAVSKGLGLVSLSEVAKNTEIEKALFQCLLNGGVETDLVVKLDAADGLGLTLPVNAMEQCLRLLDELGSQHSLGTVSYETGLAKVSLVSNGELALTDVASRVFEILAGVGIQVKLLSTSEIKLSVVIAEEKLQHAVRALHHAFALNKV